MGHLTKKILGVAVSACIGAAAHAAEKTPTLGQVLKASGLEATGYIDTSYTYRTTDSASSSFRIYDTEKSSFNLHAVDVAVSYLPENGFGGFVQVDFGADANVSASAGTGASDEFDIQEAYVQYAAGPVKVIAGKFATLAGAEVIEGPGNTNFSRSFLFGFAIPFTHTGVRATFAPSDALAFKVGVNNGWDVFRQSITDTRKTLELGVSAAPVKNFSLSAAVYNGEAGGGAQIGERTLVDIVATFDATDALSFVLNIDRGEQDKALAGGGKAKWNGVAGYVNYKLSEQWRLSVRAEQFDDKDGFRTGSAQKLKEGTVALAYMPSKDVELRGEVRYDRSNQPVFVEDGQAKKSQGSLGLQAIYKF